MGVKRPAVDLAKPETTAPWHKVDRLLDTIGDGMGLTEMASASNIYRCVPPIGKRYTLSRVNVYIEDNGKFRGDRYGSSTSLTNGINITLYDTSGSLFCYTPRTIKKIGHWHLLAGVDMHFTNFPVGNDVVAVRWSFWKGSGYILLNGNKGEFLEFAVRDDLSDLVSHMAQVQGVQGSI